MYSDAVFVFAIRRVFVFGVGIKTGGVIIVLNVLDLKLLII